MTRTTKKNHTLPWLFASPISRASKSGILSLSSFCPGQDNHWINFIPKSLYLASTSTTLKVEQSVLLPLVKEHLHLEGDLWQNKQPHFSHIYTSQSSVAQNFAFLPPHADHRHGIQLPYSCMCVLFSPGAVSAVCFFISVGFFFFNLFASFPSEGGSRGWPLSPSNSQKRSVCSSTVYPQEESYFAICMAWTLCFNPKSNIRCMRLFFFFISLSVWPAAQSLISACQSDPNCYLKFFWLISPHRLKQNNSATVFTLFLLPSWCLLSVFSNIPCLLSRSQQYISNGN